MICGRSRQDSDENASDSDRVRTDMKNGDDNGAAQQLPANLHSTSWAMLKILLASRPDIITNEQLPPRTRAFLAAEIGNTKAVQSTIESGKVTLSEQNPDRQRLIHVSAEKGHIELLQYILAKDPTQANAVNGHGEYPIHLAATMGSYESVKALLDFQADLNVMNAYNETPLYMAAYNGHKEIATLLCRRPACKLLSPNMDGICAHHIARSAGREDISNIILRALRSRCIWVLLIGLKKNKYPECPLAVLNVEIIKKIASYM